MGFTRAATARARYLHWTKSAVALMAALTLSACAAHAEPRAAVPFQLASELLDEGSIQLSNGKDVTNPADWQSLVFARFTSRNGAQETCTASLVGPFVLLTAAHCLDGEGGQRSASLVVDDATLTLACEMHPAYLAREPNNTEPRGPEDYALCEIPVRSGAGHSLAQIEFDFVEISHPPSQGRAVLLTGFGCIKTVRNAYGRLRSEDGGDILRLGEDNLAASRRAGFLATMGDLSREPVICAGDSGGPLFVGPTLRDIAAPRRIVGVNSFLAPRRSHANDNIVWSFMAPTATPIFETWARAWLNRPARRGARICGINEGEATRCRRR